MNEGNIVIEVTTWHINQLQGDGIYLTLLEIALIYQSEPRNMTAHDAITLLLSNHLVT